MRPAYSVILLTTLIGAAQGLFAVLFGLELAGRAGLLPAPGHGFLAMGALASLGLLGAGLVASIFHLGRPARGWRAFSQWRTSWLSREILVLPGFGIAALAYAVLHGMGATTPGGAQLVAGLLGTILALALFVCTGMIYACLPFLREWHSPLTVLNYLLLGLASGSTLAAAFSAAAEPALAVATSGCALAMTLAAFAGRAGSLVRNAGLHPPSTPQSAIGVKHARVVQVTQGFTAQAYNTREFFHGRSPGVDRKSVV